MVIVKGHHGSWLLSKLHEVKTRESDDCVGLITQNDLRSLWTPFDFVDTHLNSPDLGTILAKLIY